MTKKIIKASLITGILLANSIKSVSAQVFGNVDTPPGVGAYESRGGISALIANLLRFLIVVAGLYAVFNFIIAGYGFMGAGGDPKKIADAWARIWQTLIGLLVAVGAFVLGAIFSRIFFGDYTTLLQLTVYGPN